MVSSSKASNPPFVGITAVLRLWATSRGCSCRWGLHVMQEELSFLSILELFAIVAPLNQMDLSPAGLPAGSGGKVSQPELDLGARQLVRCLNFQMHRISTIGIYLNDSASPSRYGHWYCSTPPFEAMTGQTEFHNDDSSSSGRSDTI